LELFEDGFRSFSTSIDTTTFHMNIYTCKRVMCALVLNIWVIPSNENMETFHISHPWTKVNLPPFLSMIFI
jgi:hypothetical protein